MPIDLALLRSHATFDDSRLGIRERFLTPVIDGIQTVAVMGTPLGETRSTGWLVCGSFGPERDALTRFDVALARRLAAAGFPVLRYHARGYGDSQDGFAGLPDPATHVADAVAAAEILRDAAGVDSIGLTGARFGATVAVLAAGGSMADALVLIEPVTDGRSYIRSLLVRARASELDGAGPTRIDGTARDGVLDLDGLAVPEVVADAFARLDPVPAAKAFGGGSLLLRVSRNTDMHPEWTRLAEALGAMEGRCALETVVHPDAHRLGLPPFRKLAPPSVAGERRRPRKTDMQVDLTERTIGPVVRWSVALDDRSRQDVGG